MPNYEAILTEAHAAADKAILDHYAAGNVEQPYNCGFAWVTIDGRSGMARHCRNKMANRHEAGRDAWLCYGDKSESGWQWWSPGNWPTVEQVKAVRPDFDDRIYTQDMSFNFEGAKAFAEVLTKHGVAARASQRLD